MTRAVAGQGRADFHGVLVRRLLAWIPAHCKRHFLDARATDAFTDTS